MKAFFTLLILILIISTAISGKDALLIKATKRPGDNVDIQGRIIFNAAGQSKININGDVFYSDKLYQYKYGDINNVTYYKEINSYGSDLTSVEVQRMIDALIPQFEKMQTSSYLNINSTIENYANRIIADQRNTNALLDKLDYFFERFATVLDEQLDSYFKSKSSLLDYSEGDWIELKPFSTESLARLEYKGGTYSALLMLRDKSLVIVQHCYSKYGDRLPFKRVSDFDPSGFSLVQLINGKYVYINSKLVVVSDTYNYAEPIYDGVGMVRIDVKRKSEYTYLHFNDDEVFMFGDTYRNAKSFRNGFGQVKKSKHSKWKMIDRNGRLISTHIDRLSGFDGEYAIAGMIKKRFFGKNKIKFGIIDREGRYIIKPKYRRIDDSYNFFILVDNNFSVYWNKAIRENLEFRNRELKLDLANSHKYNGDIVCVRLYNSVDKFYYFLNSDGDIIHLSLERCDGNMLSVNGNKGIPCGSNGLDYSIPPIHQKIFDIKEGVRRAILSDSEYTTYYLKIKGRCKYLAIGNTSLTPKKMFYLGEDFSGGLAAVLVKIDGNKLAWGFINKDGIFVIRPQYEKVIKGFENGAAQVQTFQGDVIYINENNEETKIRW